MSSLLDIHIGSLQKLLVLLDRELVPLSERVLTSRDPESDGLCDHSEYLIGVGFVATQKYMDEIIREIEDRPGTVQILNAGPVLSNGHPFARSVWAAANYWKHGGEWWEVAFQRNKPERKVKESNQRDEQAAFLEAYGVFGRDYLCSNVLATISGPRVLSLETFVPLLQDWREEIWALPILFGEEE